MDQMAYTVVVQDEFRLNDFGDKCYWRLVLADASGGYHELKETGATDDPFYVAKGPIWFATQSEGTAEADRRNKSELRLDPKEAMSIVFKSMGFNREPMATRAERRRQLRSGS